MSFTEIVVSKVNSSELSVLLFLTKKYSSFGAAKARAIKHSAIGFKGKPLMGKHWVLHQHFLAPTANASWAA